MAVERSPLKIALVGACCTGKTTLIERSLELYKGNGQITFVREGAREYLSSTKPLPENPLDIQRGIRNFTLQNEEKAHGSQAKIIICDSSAVDQVVYTRAFIGKPESEELYDEIADRVSSYDKFFMLDPQGVPYKNDEVRTQTSEERQLVHDTFLDVFAEKGIVYEMLSGTEEQRFKEVDELVQMVFRK
jgi:nicotinamide riboside kinase